MNENTKTTMFKLTILLLTISIMIFSGCTNQQKLVQNNFDTNISENILFEEEHDHDHDHSVEIEGKEMKSLTVKQVADLWEIDENILLEEIIKEFDFKGNYTTDTILEEMRLEYEFSPAIIKNLAESIKNETTE